MKTYTCDKCGNNYLTIQRPNEPDVCDHPVPVPENSRLDYPIRHFLEASGDWCPLCHSELYNQINSIMNFVNKED